MIMLLVSSVLFANDKYEEEMKKKTDEWRKVDVSTIIFLLQTENIFLNGSFCFLFAYIEFFRRSAKKSVKVV